MGILKAFCFYCLGIGQPLTDCKVAFTFAEISLGLDSGLEGIRLYMEEEQLGGCANGSGRRRWCSLGPCCWGRVREKRAIGKES